MLAQEALNAGPAHRYIDDDARWDAVLRRDRAADGAFFTCVKTTGVYCLASCAGRPLRRNVVFHDTRRAAEAAGFRACKRCHPERLLLTPIEDASIGARVAKLDWTSLGAALDAYGCATTGPLLTPRECVSLASLYADDSPFRSRIVMARHGFGRGEYKYFAEPLPPLVGDLRAALYPPLSDLANRWNEALGELAQYPRSHADYLQQCRRRGQTRPTPLLLQYGPGDYNCLHQDVYGEEVFPLQVAFLLSDPRKDFTGGEFVLTEQRPRMQSRAEVVPLMQGEGVVFPVHHRPVAGTRGTYRVNMRHGVSRIRTGRRHTLGVIFHDAK